MNAPLEVLNFKRFNVTKDIREFRDDDIGALFIGSEIGFKEIGQDLLNSLVIANQQNPYEFCDKTMLEFQPDEIFIEESFNSLKEMKAFIHKVFTEFRVLDWSICFDIIKKLETFSETINSEELNCRFEVISGDSCRLFHYDTVHSRMISTYAGPGTEVKNPDYPAVLELHSGSSLIVKGTGFPGFKPVTQHRSPQIKNLNIKRFLFIADHVG